MLAAILMYVDGAAAHSPEFGVSALSARPEAPSELWAAVEGWGMIHSTDGGASFAWLCEESIGVDTVYDVLAWDEAVALAGTVDGLMRVDGECQGTSVTGLDAGFVLKLARWQGKAAVALIGPERGGVYLCDDDGCAATALEGPAFYPKSFAVDGDTLWVTLVHTDTLAAELYRTTDGVSFTEASSWPAGDTDPRVLWAQGENVYLWTRPRADTAEPGFRKSTDGGAHFTETFTAGYYTDSAPGFLVRDEGKTVLLGSWFGARTWASTDSGASFVEVSDTAPAVKCGLDLGDHALVCTDHLADGLDVASTTDAEEFTPITCLEEVEPSECAAEACEPYVDAWVTAAAYGGGGCHPEEEESGTPDDPPPCGCASGEGVSTAGALVAAAALLARWRLRRAQR